MTIARVTVEPTQAELLETAIVELAAAMRKLNATRLKRETIVTLLHDNSKLPKRDIRVLLDHLGNLEDVFLKPKS